MKKTHNGTQVMSLLGAVFGLFLLGSAFFPSPLQAATTYFVNVTSGNQFVTSTSGDLLGTDPGTNHITVTAGDTIVWTWTAPVGHTVSSGSGPGGVKGACSSGDNFANPQSSGTYSHTFNSPTPVGNDCFYYCEVHNATLSPSGMAGKITVLPNANGRTLTVTKSGNGNGTIASDVGAPVPINCPGVCTAALTSGDIVTLTATPATDGSTFAGYTGGGCTTDPVCTFTILTNTTVKATFSPAPCTSNCTAPTAAGIPTTTGLFDSDSVPDLVVASGATQKIQLYAMTTAGAFVGGNPPTPIFTLNDPYFPQDIAAGSFNNATDAFDDIVVLNTLSATDTTTILTLYYGNRAGSFPLSPSKQFFVAKADGVTPEKITSVTAGDVNGDGKSDLVVTLEPTAPATDPTPKILLGNGDGTFTNTLIWSVKRTIDVTISGNGSGTVTSSPAGISCPSTSCSALFDSGAVMLTAAPSGASTFIEWTGDCTGSALSTTVTITSTNLACDANFKVAVASVTVAPTSVTLATGLTALLTATALDSTGAAISGESFIWSSSNTSACTVNAALGLVKAVGAGTATITATDQGKSATATCVSVRPDVRANSVSGSGAFFISESVFNSGTIAIPKFQNSYYLSLNNALTVGSSDILIGSRFVSNLAVSGTSAVSTQVILSNIPTGVYYLKMFADSANALIETDEANNIVVSTGTYAIGPDLTVLGLSGTVSSANIIISDTEANFAPGNEAAGASTVSFYFQKTTTYNPATDIFLGSRSVPTLAAVTGNNSASTTVAIPPTMPMGTYYVCAYSDSANVVAEVNETNNAKCTTGTYAIGPDLTVYSLSGTVSVSSIIIANTEANLAPATQFAGASIVSFYFQKTTTYNPATDTFIGFRSVPTIAVNAVSSASTTFPIPPTLPGGIYYVCAVADSATLVSEINETNNTKCTTGTYTLGPDLVVNSLSAIKSGSNFYVSDTEINSGNQPADSFIVSFYLSTDNVFSPTTDKLLGSRGVIVAGGLTTNAINSATTIFQAPTGTTAGNYYIIAVTDSSNLVVEINETNNTKATTGTFPAP
jgi:plastocyanin